MDAMHALIYFEKFNVHGDMKTILAEFIKLINKKKV